VAQARSAGFSRIVDVTDAYDGLDPAGLAVEPDDFHPNAAGHAHLAGRLDEALGALPELRLLRGPALERSAGPVAGGTSPSPGTTDHRVIGQAIPWAFRGAEPP
jgi:hypothetical protein